MKLRQLFSYFLVSVAAALVFFLLIEAATGTNTVVASVGDLIARVEGASSYSVAAGLNVFLVVVVAIALVSDTFLPLFANLIESFLARLSGVSRRKTHKPYATPGRWVALLLVTWLISVTTVHSFEPEAVGEGPTPANGEARD